MSKNLNLCHYIASRNHWDGTLVTVCAVKLDEKHVEINPWFVPVDCPTCRKASGSTKGTVR
jgi:hypothetical protein